MRRLVIFIVVLVIPLLTLSGCMLTNGVVAAVAESGRDVTRDFNVADFNSVEAGSAFSVEINQGDVFNVVISADERVMDHVVVRKVGSTLRIGMDGSGPHGFTLGSPEARITMPKLEELRLGGASHGVIRGFASHEDISIDLSGASDLTGRVEARGLKLGASGASNARLEGTATSIMLDISGASRADLRDLRAENASVYLSGASNGRISASEKLDYVLSGSSRLEYQGRPQIGTADVSGASTASGR